MEKGDKKMTLTKKQRHKIYMRVSRRYKIYAKRIGKDWRKVRINDLLYDKAYARELKREEQKPTNLRPSRKFEQIRGFSRPKRDQLDFLINPSDARSGASKHSESCTCPRCSGGYGELSDAEMTGIGEIFGEPKAPEEPKPMPDLRSKEEKIFALKVKYNPEIQQAKAKIKWLAKKEEEENEE